MRGRAVEQPESPTVRLAFRKRNRRDHYSLHGRQKTLARRVANVVFATRFWLPASALAGAFVGMGAKYLPTIKDQKAAQRFQQRQNPLHKFKKAVAEPAPKKDKKK